MEIRFGNSPDETKGMDTQQLRKNFLVEIMSDNRVVCTYTHYDRAIIGGAKPIDDTLLLENHEELKSNFFLERREIGIINVGNTGQVIADGVEYTLNKLDCVYLGRGTEKVEFKSMSANEPASFYFMSVPAHRNYPNTFMAATDASPVELGDTSTSNERVIYKYIHLDGIKSCQLVMGLTILKDGSVWNSVPPHTHTRRMESYFYFDIPAEHQVFHYMGEPQETRHLAMKNHQAAISPPWSVHFGCGTTNYAFIWAMAGENQVFSDMDQCAIVDLL
jgi:4-deoxy-L-threo-5-hexosulose-uronate ketol-isomerase